MPFENSKHIPNSILLYIVHTFVSLRFVLSSANLLLSEWHQIMRTLFQFHCGRVGLSFLYDYLNYLVLLLFFERQLFVLEMKIHRRCK